MGRSTLPRPTDRLEIGTKLRVSPFCIGMVEDPETIPAAYEAGINFFFVSADLHWPCYEAVRIGLKRLLDSGVKRADLVIAAVSYPTQPEFCTGSFVEVIEAAPWIRHIDVCVMGGVYATDIFARLPVYARHKKTGHCGASAIGATFHDRAAAPLATNHRLIDIAFIRYNPAHSGADYDVFPDLVPVGRGPVFGFKSAQGSRVALSALAGLASAEDNWRPEITDYYRYALSSPLDGILCAPANPAQVRELVGCLGRGPLSPEECAYMRELGGLAASGL